MSIRAYKYRIDANKATREKLQWVLDRCRELYNAGLQERRDAYEACIERHPNYYDEASRKRYVHVTPLRMGDYDVSDLTAKAGGL